MTIENKKIDQEELDWILANADEDPTIIEFIDCNIANIKLDNRVLLALFLRCTVNRLVLSEANMYSLSIINSVVCRLYVSRLDIQSIYFEGVHIGNFQASTATVFNITSGGGIEIDKCTFDRLSVYAFRKKADDGSILAGEEAFPRTLLDAALNDAPPICPSEGPFIGYKKAVPDVLGGYAIVKLLILEDAERVGPVYSRKCRASKAKVLSIKTPDGDDIPSAHSLYYPEFKYEVGATVIADKFDKDLLKRCSNGVNFFMTEKEAREYTWI